MLETYDDDTEKKIKQNKIEKIRIKIDSAESTGAKTTAHTT
jgi:hypothetical protein